MVFIKTRKVRVHPKSAGGNEGRGPSTTATTTANRESISSVDIACEDFILSVWENLHKVQVKNLTDEQIKEATEAFAEFDKNGNGTINKKKLKAVLQTLGKRPTKEQLEEIIYTGKDVIDFIEFLKMIDQMANDFDDAIKEAFYIFDSDGSGAISSEEFRQVMMTLGSQMTDEEVNEIIDKVDNNGDGQINFDKFITMLKDAV